MTTNFESDVRASLQAHELRFDSMEQSVNKIAISIDNFAAQTNALITQNARFEEKLVSMTELESLRLEALESAQKRIGDEVRVLQFNVQDIEQQGQAIKRIGDDVRALQMTIHATEQKFKAKGDWINNLFNYGWKISTVALPLVLGAYIFIGSKLVN